MHTQTIIQNALIKKKLEEQRENFRKRQEQQHHHQQQQQHKHQNHPNVSSPVNSPAKQTLSPTPLAFTPTSVLRKMTAEKEPEGANESFQQVEIIIASASANHAKPKFNSSVVIPPRNYTSHKNQSPKEKKWNGLVAKGLGKNGKNTDNQKTVGPANKMSPKKKASRSKNTRSFSTGINDNDNNNSKIDQNESLKETIESPGESCLDNSESKMFDQATNSNSMILVSGNKVLDFDPKVSDLKNVDSSQILCSILNVDSKKDKITDSSEKIVNCDKIMLDSDPSISTSASTITNFDSKNSNIDGKESSMIDFDPKPSVSSIKETIIKDSAIGNDSVKNNNPIIIDKSVNKVMICEAQNSNLERTSSLDSLD